MKWFYQTFCSTTRRWLRGEGSALSRLRRLRAAFKHIELPFCFAFVGCLRRGKTEEVWRTRTPAVCLTPVDSEALGWGAHSWRSVIASASCRAATRTLWIPPSLVTSVPDNNAAAQPKYWTASSYRGPMSSCQVAVVVAVDPHVLAAYSKPSICLLLASQGFPLTFSAIFCGGVQRWPDFILAAQCNTCSLKGRIHLYIWHCHHICPCVCMCVQSLYFHVCHYTRRVPTTYIWHGP